MSDKPKPRESQESLWGDIARMEAEVYDPEEIATSVYDISDVEGMREQIARAKAARDAQKARQQPPVPLALPDDDEDDEDDEEDATFVYSAEKLKAGLDPRSASAPLAPLPAAPDIDDFDDEDDDLQTVMVDRESLRGALPGEESPTDEAVAKRTDEAPSIELTEESFDFDGLSSVDDVAAVHAPVSGLSSGPVSGPVSGPSSGPISAPRSGPRDDMARGTAPVEAPAPITTPHAAAPQRSAWATYGPFLGLVVLGFLLGYLIVLYMRPPG